MKNYLLLIACLIFIPPVMGQLKISFPSTDGLIVTADWYPVNEDFPVILLCHQNQYSRGEYIETALRLNKFGFNCLAIDQRAGKAVNDIENETAERANAKYSAVLLQDAEQDVTAAVEYLYRKYNRQIIILGSSYSASLALEVANKNDHVSAVVAFSPGEYFDNIFFLRNSIKNFYKPLFITSSRNEAPAVTDLLKDVNSRLKIQYIPKTEGDHGSKVLWSSAEGNQEYWIALMGFLNKVRKDSDSN